MIGRWRGSCRARWAWLGGLLVVVALIGAAEDPSVAYIFLVGCLPLGLCVLAFRRIDVTVDADGVTIRYGLGGWPVQQIGLDRIRRAEEIKLDPLRWGGWGYRGSLVIAHRAAVVLRKGPALRLELDEDFRQFAVTVDDPAGAVAALRAHLA